MLCKQPFVENLNNREKFPGRSAIPFFALTVRAPRGLINFR